MQSNLLGQKDIKKEWTVLWSVYSNKEIAFSWTNIPHLTDFFHTISDNKNVPDLKFMVNLKTGRGAIAAINIHLWAPDFPFTFIFLSP